MKNRVPIRLTGTHPGLRAPQGLLLGAEREASTLAEPSLGLINLRGHFDGSVTARSKPATMAGAIISDV